ncbi:MAG: bifunctional folylpolyglutamate synthase/dihydrofolate synthase [Planctomycetota bacterium]
MTLRTVDDALEALSRFTDYERTRAHGPRDFDLSRPRGLLERLGSPHHGVGARVVQVAGTKGKGSTARFVESILRSAGLRTGRFLSPHLESVLERIAVNGEPIAEVDFAARVEQVVDAVEGKSTFFESLLAAACLHFAEVGTEAVVLEVGLGGRLDATTVVPSTHNIITEISYEHTEILGTTLKQIAAEKAGTIRFGVPVWSGVDPRTPPGQVIRALAMQREAPYAWVPPPQEVRADASGLRWGEIELNSLGRHQAHNAALAAAACADLGREVLARGLAAAEQPGCCERRGSEPTVILDGAHTLSSIQATIRTIQEHFPAARPELVFALATDKDLNGIAGALAPAVGGVHCTRVDDKRGNRPGLLAAHPTWGERAHAIESPAEALEAARKAAGPEGLVLVTGSLYLAGALRSLT